MLKDFIATNGVGIVNMLDSDGFTPMHWAAYEGTYEIIE